MFKRDSSSTSVRDRNCEQDWDQGRERKCPFHSIRNLQSPVLCQLDGLRPNFSISSSHQILEEPRRRNQVLDSLLLEMKIYSYVTPPRYNCLPEKGRIHCRKTRVVSSAAVASCAARAAAVCRRVNLS
ncbi:hypothetical protein EVAR_55165_1 [Eumeta japonica]|uniref:Uncharacterized protein n=1 Tax=Eumeta variegata TaxID=151549 RepID=A0A4C1YB49_EUMVA|nr:hypothetical protein EVAR_55165_1 [Eumeta japonica]